MANIDITRNYSDGNALTKAMLDTSFDDVETWLNARDNATASWLNVKITGASSADVDLLSVNGSGATTNLIVNNTATDGDPGIKLQLSGSNRLYMYSDDSDSDYVKFTNNTGVCMTIGQGATWTGFAHGTAVLPGIGVFDGTTNNKGLYGGTNQIGVTISATGQVLFTDGTIEPVTDNDVALGTVSKKWSDVKSYLINGSDYGFANGYILREWPCTKDDVYSKSDEWMKANANLGIQVINDIGEVVAIIGRDGTIKAKKFEIVESF